MMKMMNNSNHASKDGKYKKMLKISMYICQLKLKSSTRKLTNQLGKNIITTIYSIPQILD